MSVRPAKTQISLGIRPVWSESSVSAWRKLWFLATYWVHSEDSDRTGRMPRLIWVFAGRTCHFVGFVMRRLIYEWISTFTTCQMIRNDNAFHLTFVHSLIGRVYISPTSWVSMYCSANRSYRRRRLMNTLLGLCPLSLLVNLDNGACFNILLYNIPIFLILRLCRMHS